MSQKLTNCCWFDPESRSNSSLDMSRTIPKSKNINIKKIIKKKERKRRRRRRREQNKSRPAVTLRKQGWRSGGEWLRVRVRLRVSESVREELGEVKVWNWVRLRVSESEREKFGEVSPSEMRGGWVSLRCELKSEEWGVRVYIYIYRCFSNLGNN